MSDHTERLERLEQALQDEVQSWRLNPVVEALQALRGVQFTVAVTTVAEIGDLTRFDNPRELMKFLGSSPCFRLVHRIDNRQLRAVIDTNRIPHHVILTMTRNML